MVSETLISTVIHSTKMHDPTAIIANWPCSQHCTARRMVWAKSGCCQIQ